ncbi:2'-5' RNA ligase [Candidatus Daviesbacteria bacterium RIFCSPHIGHO2_12_FULL_37_11]|uniref:RNA 2',3'-cyclic phosphodiesterase n=1 Tax=Candidatus Daviesbacteria bacterium RIFCSPHIGHO2_12_FULL_37_11 TaxID=1797777 RepID=A0A1F5KE35_9BACT|nr:MAG: 2'-5' RNA ligase [Candidatus Daviesbacteria bacterium GWA1_38_6]OGE16005.1 MAG: 2'-5' RNA ligase [Candidatus Daviesbacteria bacterium RIFCSPHIGHO2_01_FULL_37_27]OGE39114.1 MAG: 2'-5' RNA ligase [Candidatus Daviesbacteria bacterium RIFCSPHIGHO2_12_FULL_37_11]
MRFFIALDLPEVTRNELKEVQEKLKPLIPGAKFTDPEKLHLTIAFVGEQDDEFEEKLIKILEASPQGIPPFTVTPSYIDGFPHLHTANTLWVGVKEDIDKLYELRHHIKDGLSSLGLPVDQRRFVPHIAIAKLDHFRLKKEVEKEFENIMSGNFSPILVSSVKLFESVPEHGFHKHNTLAKIQLG